MPNRLFWMAWLFLFYLGFFLLRRRICVKNVEILEWNYLGDSKVPSWKRKVLRIPSVGMVLISNKWKLGSVGDAIYL